jgi:hypothetical protein
VTITITQRCAVLAAGIIHSISAMSHPAKMPRSSVRPKSGSIALRESSVKVWRSSALNISVRAATSAKAAAPTGFVSSTTAHRRATLPNVLPSRFAISGTMTRSVFSVNICWLPRTTIRNPTL